MRRLLPFVFVALVAFALGWVVKGGREKSEARPSAAEPSSEVWHEVTVERAGVQQFHGHVYRITTAAGSKGEPLDKGASAVTVWEVDPETGHRTHTTYHAR